MSTTGNSPYWWQRLIPTYGKWGGPGWSAGIWNNDPVLTDWSVDGIDEMDEAFKRHDFAYQSGADCDLADLTLVRELMHIPVTGARGRVYRFFAMAVFSVWPLIRYVRSDF